MTEPFNNTGGCCRLRSGRVIQRTGTSKERNDVAVSTDSDDDEISFSDDLLHTIHLSANRNEMTEGTSALIPAPFYGKQEEDVVEFLRTIDLWSTLRRADDEAKRATLALLLKGNASSWFHTQPNTITSSYRALKDALIDRYGPRPTHAWKATADLWQLRQQKEQSTDDFITAVVKAGHRIGIEDDQLHLVALNGLRPSIRQHVIQHPIKDLDDLRQWGRLTELSLQDAPDDDSSLRATARELAELKDEIRRLRIHSIQSPPASRSTSPAPATPPTSRRVQFQSDSTGASHSNTPRYQRSTTDHRPHFRNSDQRRTPTGTSSTANYGNNRCGNCGGKHVRHSNCPARDKTCFYCRKVGHFQSVCRSASRARSNNHI